MQIPKGSGKLLALILIMAFLGLPTEGTEPDMRNVETGSRIPSINYADQPYVAITPDGDWVCVLTTGNEHEFFS